jgi:hypothetical protein
MLKKRIGRFKRFIEIGITHSFFDSSASLLRLLTDRLHGIVKRLDNPSRWDEVFGSLPANSILPEFNQEKSADRSKNKSRLSLFYSLNPRPEFIDWIVRENFDKISKVLGKNIYIDAAYFYRNFHIEEEFQAFDVYANIWHQDSGDGNRVLHIFIFPQDVGLQDGPFEYVPAKATRDIFVPEFIDRNYTNGLVRSISGSKKLTGKKGDYAIINPTVSVHRAGVPSLQRDLIVVSLYTEWRRPKSAAKF